MEGSCDISENFQCHCFQHIVLHLSGVLVGFLDQLCGTSRVVFSSKVANLCEVRIISLSVITSVMPYLARKRKLDSISIRAFLLLAVSSSWAHDDNLCSRTSLVVA